MTALASTAKAPVSANNGTGEGSPTLTGLALLRAPFPAHQISKLPKETKKQREEREANRAMGVSCKVCGGWHHKNAVHLDYVGHAALTDRLLDCDPLWSWEPAAFRDGLPAFDGTGGLWIKLTVCGVSRLGYGHAAAKPQMDPGSREKEVIGDALRNAAMRFGAALDLWHKGDLHAPTEANDSAEEPGNPTPNNAADPVTTLASRADAFIGALNATITPGDLDKAWSKGSKLCADLDMSDPEKLAVITKLYESLRDEMDANPFAREAA
jgi:hypothetical protein